MQMHSFEISFMNNFFGTLRQRRTTFALQLNLDEVGAIERWRGQKSSEKNMRKE